MPVDLETADVMKRIFRSIDETKGLVSCIVVCKANFLMMAYYLLDLRQLLEDLSREEYLANATSLEAQASLQGLADTLEAINVFTKRCKNSSRILLLYQSNSLVDQITKQFGKLVDCLSLMLQKSTMLSSTTEVQIKEMQNKLREALFYVEPEHEKIAQQLSQALINGQADDTLATELLRVISANLNMKFYEAGELIQELKGDLETARIERREQELSLLQSLHRFLNPAVLPDVNLLVPEDSPFSANDLAIPSSFFCPITRQIMEDPVMLAEAGYTYERSAILKWFEGGNKICPNTGKELENFELIPNLKLKQNMEEFFDLKRHKTMLHAIQQIRSQGTSTDIGESYTVIEESVNTVKQLLDVNLKYKRLLVTLDGIQPLVTILKPSTPQLKEKIFRILFSIAALGDEYKASIVEAKAVPVLLRILQRNPAVNGGPVQLLWELSKSESGRKAILDVKASVVVVASAFNLCTNDQKLQAEQLLYNLCEHDSTAVIQAATSGVFGPLVRKLASGDEDLQLKMADTICTLNANEKSMQSLVGAGVIQPLLNLLQHGTEACKLKAAKAFELLSSFDDNKIAIAKSGSLSVLVKALTSPFRDIVTLVLATLANLATEKQITAEIEHEGAVSQLIRMFTWEDIKIHENALTELVKHDAVKPLLECISIRNDPRLIEAAARALKAIYKCPTADKNDIFQDMHLRDLITLLDPDSLNPKTDRDKIASVHTSELAATIIARCCETNEQQIQIESAGAFPALVKLLVCGFSKAQEAALDALAYLCRENSEFGKAIVETKSEASDSPVKIMLNLIRDKSPTMQLVSAKCLTHLSRANAIMEYFNDITLIVLPTLVKLLDEKGPVREEAPQVLAYLIRDNEELQKAACDSGAVLKLADFVTHVNDQDNSYYDPLSDSDKLKENALMALAAISSLTDEGRKLVVDAKIVPHIVKAMSHRSYGVRAAACQCTRSLSRSVNILRTNLVDAGIAIPLFKLLSDESTDVQKTACATICNIVLDFSPMKRIIIEQEGIEKLVELVHSSDNTLRLNAIWALTNLVYHAEPEIKDSVMKALTYSTMETLIMDQEIDIQEKALNLLRNLGCTRPYDIEEVFKGLGENRLMSIIESKLCSWNEEIIKQILYVINNIATGADSHKKAIMNRSNILTQIKNYMSHNNPDIRVIAVWCLINLAWTEDKNNSSPGRVRELRQLGFEEMVKSMTNDENLDVREKVKTAISQFSQV